MFYRLIKMTGKWYAAKFDNLEDEAEAINAFLEQGEPIVLCDDLDWFAEKFDIDEDEIEIVD